MKSQMASTCLRTQQIFMTLTVGEGQRFEVGVYYLSIDLQPNFEMHLCTLQNHTTNNHKTEKSVDFLFIGNSQK